MVQSTMILPFSIQSKFQDYFEGIVRVTYTDIDRHIYG